MTDIYTVLCRWRDDELKSQLEWHRAAHPQLTERDLKAYEEGFRQGWHKLAIILEYKGYFKGGIR